ncbi:MAG: alanine racemase [bacterium]|nr:alanine racemase [bacterium]MDT8366023.1 alanine racemase [bacterium]
MPGRDTDRGTCWIDIDLAALRSNFHIAEKHLEGNPPILAVVKANAYGHGAVPVSRALLEEGASILGVATVDEARELREGGIRGRILILGRMVQADIQAALRWHTEITLQHPEMARWVSETATSKGVTVPVHLKVDTGMTRLGFYWETAYEEILKVLELPGLDLCCVFTHFANADLGDREFTQKQILRFEELQAKLENTGLKVCHHISNSAAILTGQTPEGCGARPGIMLYGASPSANIPSEKLRPVLSWKCRVLQIKKVPEGTGISYGHDFITTRPSRIATISVGYADGYLRCLTNRGQVLISGKRAPVVGRVTMDMTMVDVTDLSEEISAGDEVVVLGSQGEDNISAEEVAAWADTINYEIFCALSHRVPRYYLDGR